MAYIGNRTQYETYIFTAYFTLLLFWHYFKIICYLYFPLFITATFKISKLGGSLRNKVNKIAIS